MIIRSKVLGLAVLGTLFVGIFISALLGLWKTKSERVPQRFKEGGAAGEFNPGDIRGSYSFGEISELFNIPLDMLGRAFRLPDDVDQSAFMNKDLEVLYADLEGDVEIGTASMRLFVAYYKGLPYASAEDAYLLRPAVNILKNQAKLTPEQISYLNTHVIEINASEGNPAKQGENATNDVDHSEGAQMVRGKTTFADILAWGVSEETIESVIGGEIPNGLILVRDYCTGNGLEFSTIKAALQAEIGNLGE